MQVRGYHCTHLLFYCNLCVANQDLWHKRYPQKKTLWILRPTLDGGPGSKFLGANLDPFDTNWILELDPALDLSLLHLWFSKSWALFWALFFGGLNQFIFPPKWCHVGLALICHFFGLGPSSKGHGSNLWLSSNRIALFHWTLDPWLKWS
jgi:hypothetical protein